MNTTKRIKLKDGVEIWLDFEAEFQSTELEKSFNFQSKYNPDILTPTGAHRFDRMKDEYITGKYVPVSGILILENQSVTIPKEVLQQILNVSEEVNKELPKKKIREFLE